jgi:hypothetical protein
MKRVNESENLSINLTRVRLYRGDLDYLLDALRDAGLTTAISDSEFIYDDLDDLKKQRGSKIKNLKIEGTHDEGYRRERITLQFSNCEDIRLYMYGRRSALEVGYFRVRDYLLKKKRWHQIATNPWLAYIFFCFIPLGVLVLKNTTSLPLANSIFIAITFTCSWWLFCYVWTRTYPIILLDRTHEHESFWKRNGDKIILLVIGALVGGLLTQVFDALVRNFE